MVPDQSLTGREIPPDSPGRPEPVDFPIPNLDEIEYLHKFCDVIVTSQSGPGCLSFTDAVVYDENKTLILFCVDTIDWYFADGTCEYIRTQNFEDLNVLNLIKDTIERKLNK